eukprot:1228693-Prymnesium_polylepis.1
MRLLERLSRFSLSLPAPALLRFLCIVTLALLRFLQTGRRPGVGGPVSGVDVYRYVVGHSRVSSVWIHLARSY